MLGGGVRCPAPRNTSECPVEYGGMGFGRWGDEKGLDNVEEGWESVAERAGMGPGVKGLIRADSRYMSSLALRRVARLSPGRVITVQAIDGSLGHRRLRGVTHN